MSQQLGIGFRNLDAPPNRPSAARTVSESLLLEAYGSDALRHDSTAERRPSPGVQTAPTSEHLEQPPNTPKHEVVRTLTDQPEPRAMMTGMTTILAGESGKAFEVHTDLLTSRSPYFRDTLNLTIHDTISYPILDEFSASLFVRWLYGAGLLGPTCFYTLHHYFGLYHLALQFGIEKLQNEVMDLTRSFYRKKGDTEDLWYELGSTYVNTEGPNSLRGFLVGVAVFQTAREGFIDEHLQAVIARGGVLATDIAKEILKVRGGGLVDAREGPDCAWHVHNTTPVCSPLSDQPSSPAC